MNDVLNWVIDWVESVDPALRTIVAGVAIMLETSVLVGLVVPGDTVVLISSLGITDIWQYVALLFAVIVGALIGESIGFGLGRWFGPRLQRTRLGRLIGQERWDRANAYLERRGGIAVFLSRFLPVLHSLIPVTVGMSKMRYRTFIAWTLPACIIWASLYATVGWLAADVLRTNRDELKGQLTWAGVAFVGIIATFVLVVWLVKHFLAKAEERYMTKAFNTAATPPASGTTAAHRDVEASNVATAPPSAATAQDSPAEPAENTN